MMKKKVIWASVMALALAVSPMGGFGVSAEEAPADVSAETSAETDKQEEAAVNSPENVHFYDNYRCGFFWSDLSILDKTPISYPWVLQKKGGQDEWQDICGGDMRSKAGFGGYDLQISQHIEESGVYRVWVRITNKVNGLSSEWRATDEKEYTRPEKSLDTTVGYWDEAQSGLFHYPSVEGAAGYQWCLLKWNEDGGQWENVLPEFRTNPLAYQSDNPKPALVGDVGLNSPTDAGGQDKTIDFSQEINYYGPGRYCVTVKALSGNIDEVANGVEGEMSAALEIGSGGNNSGNDSGNSSEGNDSGNSSEGNDSGNSSEGNGSTAQSAPAPTLVESRVAAAESGSVVKITKEDNVNALSNADMKELLKKGDVALEMEYTYEGTDYKICIPAGTAMDNDIPWYGPLYLAQYYSVNNAQTAEPAEAALYIVQRGDTLGKIARAKGMTLKELAAKNPQIKNINKIIPGQIIYTN